VYGKKKGATMELADDMFGEGPSDSGDLFGSAAEQNASKVAAPIPVEQQNTVSSRRRLDPLERARRLRNRSVTRLGDISSIWLRRGPSSSG